MSIEVIGPKSYDYQYLVTVRAALLLLAQEDLYIQVENDSFEDAELSYQHGENVYDIELQVKQRNKDVAFDDFCGWLAHFEKGVQNHLFWKRYRKMKIIILYLLQIVVVRIW